MERKVNTLPVQNYVRTRESTVVTNLQGLSSGTVSLSLDKPSDVTVIVACLIYSGEPALFIAALDRAPSLADFDLIMSPTDAGFIKGQSIVTLHLPEGDYELRWKSCAIDATPQTFAEEGSLLVLAIDQ